MQLHRESVGVCLNASQSDSGTADLMKRLRKAKKSMQDVAFGSSGIPGMNEMVRERNEVRDPIRQSQNYGVGNPSKSKSRGAPPKKMQRCGYCSKLGHKVGGCPDNPNNKSKFEREKKPHFNTDDLDPYDDDLPCHHVFSS